MNTKNEKFTSAQRQAGIAEIIQEKQGVSIPELAGRFGVSEMPVRRDLDRLAETGRVRRTYGGTVPAERMVFEFDFIARRQANHRAKQSIAAKAIKFIQTI